MQEDNQFVGNHNLGLSLSCAFGVENGNLDSGYLSSEIMLSTSDYCAISAVQHLRDWQCNKRPLCIFESVAYGYGSVLGLL